MPESPAGPIRLSSTKTAALLPTQAKTSSRDTAAGLSDRAEPSSADVGSWGVQLAGNWSKAKALEAYSALLQQHSQVLRGHAPRVLQTKQANRGTADFYVVRVAAKTRDAAEDLCSKLRASGGACAVARSVPMEARGNGLGSVRLQTAGSRPNLTIRGGS